jgi:hypothetical protein
MCHAALSVREFLANHNIPIVLHMPHSLNFTPGNFFLFSTLKITMKQEPILSHHRDTTEYDIAAAGHYEQAYHTCIEKWKD